MKKIVLFFICAALLIACSRSMTKEQYIDVMSTLGCKGMAENTPNADQVLKDKDVTLDQIKKFRKKTKPEEMRPVANQIIRRVMECHNLKE